MAAITKISGDECARVRDNLLRLMKELGVRGPQTLLVDDVAEVWDITDNGIRRQHQGVRDNFTCVELSTDLTKMPRLLELLTVGEGNHVFATIDKVVEVKGSVDGNVF